MHRDDRDTQNDALCPRHTVGRGSAVSPAERLDIQRAHLSEPGATITSLAKEFGRTRATISKLLAGAEYEALKNKVHAELADQARDVLARSAIRAARLWAGPAMERAADKGDHRPMKDLLIATKVIDLNQHAPNLTIQIGLTLADVILPDSRVNATTDGKCRASIAQHSAQVD